MRLRQIYANRYHSSEATNAEFESIVRYLNAAELGNQTLSELLVKLFDEAGNVDLDIDFRLEPLTGIEVRVGAESPWELVANIDDLRGAPGVNVGTIDGPVFYNRQDVTATSNQTVFSYSIPVGSVDVLVYINGALQQKTAYSFSQVGSTVTMVDPQPLNTKLTFVCVRNNASNTYRRTDLVSGANQVVFPFVHTVDEVVQVYRNGILQRSGALYDYVINPDTDTITMMVAQPADTLITALVASNAATQSVMGLMMEESYATDGLIRFDRINVPTDAIAVSKVFGLTAALALRGDTYVSASTPTGSIRPGSLWVNTATAIPRLFFWSGTLWIDTNPGGLLPQLVPTDALKFLRVNATASGFEAVPLDLSQVLLISDVSVPGGVAPLDSGGKVPASMVPANHRRLIVTGVLPGALANGTYSIGILAGGLFTIDAVSVATDAGTANVQLQVDAVNVGGVAAAATTPARVSFTAFGINASLGAGSQLDLNVTGAAGLTGLAYCVQGYITG